MSTVRTYIPELINLYFAGILVEGFADGTVVEVKRNEPLYKSNGVEGTNKQLLRHLKTLVHDERVINRWSDPTILCLIVFSINDAVNSETGVRPFDAKFGSMDGPYLQLPEKHLSKDITNEWVRLLDTTSVWACKN